MGKFRVAELSPLVHSIDIPYERTDQWCQSVLLQSDQHWDSEQCDREQMRRHLDEAKRIGAPVVWCGDFFDAMQGRMDRRGTKSDIREELRTENYFDTVVEEAVKWMLPYGDLLTVIAYGNHERSVVKWSETDLLRRFVYRLSKESQNSEMYCGGYSGYVRFNLVAPNHTSTIPIHMKYYHDPGSRGKRSKGILSVDINIKESPDADIIIHGHIHRFWVVPEVVERVDSSGTVYYQRVLVCQLPSYKKFDPRRGFEIERRLGPRVTGAAWLKFRYYKDGRRDRISYTIEEAL